MGRQAYLTRIALGRSAFEPSQGIGQSSEYIQLDASQHEIPAAAQEANRNRYIQLFDERGNPINPRAHEYGRRLRAAQNDVLASIGVVERRRSPSDDLPGTYEDRLEELENEDSAGNTVALMSTLAQNVCTWWIGSIRQRVMIFRIPDAFPVSHIIASEYHATGRSLLWTGFTARLTSSLCVQATLYTAVVFRPIDRLLAVTHASRRTKHFFQRWKGWTNTCFRLSVEILFSPLGYHANLQRLGLISARPFWPSWKAFIPFSSQSLIQPLPLSSGLLPCVNAIATSPVLFLCLDHLYERWIYGIVFEAVETLIVRPDNPDLASPDDGVKSRASAVLGLRAKTPWPVREVIHRIFKLLGWTKASEANNRGVEVSPETHIDTAPTTIDVGETQITHITPLDIPTVNQTLNQESSTTRAVQNFPPEASPTASQTSDNGDDPRIRITSREGIVEMEVRLPPHVLSTTTVVEGTDSSSLHPGNTSRTIDVQELERPHYHRVSQLSTEPAQMLGAICKSQLVGWATVGLRLVTLRFMASHCLFTRLAAGERPSRPLSLLARNPMNDFRNMDIRSVGLLASRIALFGLLELSIDLGLWCSQYVVVTFIGKRFFSWGKL
ncbi:hypothetical protein P154DRAFT_444088 [Amniculicola lignicola CBS 123094]|uniref:Uncharacterized protein n=1 Tax=Amniculicola lignicola CBS 123094 TaxID=1392246 RepID=A0A6A5W2Q9_9PLEO|nr:hypothetical protein P154DRAFT_444088 [Amniculicola lignicola CBS 123094]